MITDTNAVKLTMVIFSARVILMATPMVATVENNPTLTIGVRLGC